MFYYIILKKTNSKLKFLEYTIIIQIIIWNKINNYKSYN